MDGTGQGSDLQRPRRCAPSAEGVQEEPENGEQGRVEEGKSVTEGGQEAAESDAEIREGAPADVILACGVRAAWKNGRAGFWTCTYELDLSICSACLREVSVSLAPLNMRATSSVRSSPVMRRTVVRVRPAEAFFSIT
jgi:hypothetical protein